MTSGAYSISYYRLINWENFKFSTLNLISINSKFAKESFIPSFEAYITGNDFIFVSNFKQKEVELVRTFFSDEPDFTGFTERLKKFYYEGVESIFLKFMNKPQLTINNSNENLCEIIRESISESPKKRITFAEYMELVLYHPQYGYYASHPVNIGKQGDFLTSSHWSADFGELLAEQFVQMWDIFQRPNNFTLVEMGAGQGILAEQVLGYLKQKHLDFFPTIEYLIIEKSEVLKEEQKTKITVI